MRGEKNTVFAILLIAAILILTPYYLRWLSPPTEAPDRSIPTDSLVVEQPLSEQQAQRTRTEHVTQSTRTAVETVLPPAEGEPAPIGELTEETFIVNTPLYTTTISSRGGGSILRWQLSSYTGPDSLPLDIVSDINASNLSISYIDNQYDTLNLGDFNWTADSPANTVFTLYEGEEREISFKISDATGAIARKTLKFNGDSYDLTVSLSTSGLKYRTANNRYTISWDTPLKSTERYMNDDMAYAKAYALLGDEVEELDVGAGEMKRLPLPGITSWVAMRTKYFTLALIPVKNNGTGALINATGVRTPRDEVYKKYALSIEMPVRDEKATDDFTLYLGPLSYSIVKSYDVGLEKMMNFGWSFIRPISKAVLWSFVKLHGIIPNYGFVIILFSILVKILVYPLTHKSFVSMKKMQDLQPLMAELKEKYKNDQATLQKKTMALYKEKGVNPLGGCLPLLLQMPLLFALFTVFRSTIELRGADFIWWINDLSSQDTIFTLPFSLPIYGMNVNVLPIVMGLTMYLQQKTTAASGNPQQKMMGYIMPVFMALIFNSFPSGLNLYYSLFNIFSIIQTNYLSDLGKKDSDGQTATNPQKKKLNK